MPLTQPNSPGLVTAPLMLRELKIVPPTAGMKNLSLGLSSIAKIVGSLKSNVFELAKEPIPSELI